LRHVFLIPRAALYPVVSFKLPSEVGSLFFLTASPTLSHSIKRLRPISVMDFPLLLRGTRPPCLLVKTQWPSASVVLPPPLPSQVAPSDFLLSLRPAGRWNPCGAGQFTIPLLPYLRTSPPSGEDAVRKTTFFPNSRPIRRLLFPFPGLDDKGPAPQIFFYWLPFSLPFAAQFDDPGRTCPDSVNNTRGNVYFK